MTYQLEYLEIDSRILGISTWSLSNVTESDDFAAALNTVFEKSRVSYVTCKIAADQLSMVHAAERVGFCFVETQFRTILRLNKTYDISKYPYEYIRVDTQDELDKVLEIAASSIEHDRFSRDPAIGRELSGARYCEYLLESFARKDDEIWAVQSKTSGELLTFRSHRRSSETDVNLLIGGVHEEYKGLGLGVISSHFCFNQLRESGYRRAVTHISAANIPIVNLEIGSLNFRVSDSFVVLRCVTEFNS